MERETEINNEHGDLYNCVREQLINELYQLQQLKQEGKNVSALEDNVYERLKNYIEAEDARRLAEARRILQQQYIHNEVIDNGQKFEHHWTKDELENL